MSCPLQEILVTDQSIPATQHEELFNVFPKSHFENLLKDRFSFYRTTFWYSRDQTPTNVFERIIDQLSVHANPSDSVIGIEWWFSVVGTNGTPFWLLPPHFDRSDLEEKDPEKFTYPEKASVLFLNSVPYGELVVTDQVMTRKGMRPRQPKEMRFIEPVSMRYAVFPGHLYHGVMGRMWRSKQPTDFRLSMAVNYWTEKPAADYLNDSKAALEEFEIPD